MSAAQTTRLSRTRRSVLMCWVKAKVGGVDRKVLMAADDYAQQHLRRRNYGVGQIVSVECRGTRDPIQFRRAHALATLVINSLDSFSAYVPKRDEHEVLKRLQIESETCLDYIGLEGGLAYGIPQSLSFETMPQEEFDVFYQRLIAHIRTKYWPELSVEAVEELARFAGDSNE